MITLALTLAAEERLRAEAQSKGIAAEEYARELLEEALTVSRTVGQQILDELGPEGVIGAWQSRPDHPDAQAYARELRERAWSREG